MAFDYLIFLNAKLSSLTYLLLIAASTSLRFTKKIKAWGSLLLAAIVAGLVADRLLWFALPTIILFAFLFWLTYHANNSKIRLMAGMGSFMLCFGLFFHLIPGFVNWKIADALLLSPGALPLTVYLNFDKALIGIFILGFSREPLLKTFKECKTMLRQGYPIMLWGVGVLSLVSYLAGFVTIDFKLNQFIIIWAIINLYFACIVEEALFRVFVLGSIAKALEKRSYGNQIALGISSLLFGFAHLGSVKYMALATLAGLFYGLAYQKTKRIEASILLHFLVNLVHYLCFTYPALAEVFF